MTALAILLVLISAMLHALWNFFAKSARGGATFIWLLGIMEVVFYTPIAFIVLSQHTATLPPSALFYMVIGACIHVAYFVFLSKGYQIGDLSIVYPLARGIGPLISLVFAIILFAERPSLLAVLGSLLICGGVFFLSGDPRQLRHHQARPAITFAFITGLAIAAYTIWDAYSVAHIHLDPFLYQWGIGIFRTLLLTPYACAHWQEVRLDWQQDKYRALMVGIFSPLSYLLILVTLSFSPVSYVAPLRVLSTLIGVWLGTQYLGEGDRWQRLRATAFMVIGAFMLSIG